MTQSSATLIISILFVGCSEAPSTATKSQRDHVIQRISPQRNGDGPQQKPVINAPAEVLVGGWVLSPRWRHFMGVAIQFDQFEDDEFNYWFYSDVGGVEDYPLRGTFDFDGERVVLHGKGQFYSPVWYLHEWDGQTCLVPEDEWDKIQKGEKWDDSRILYRDPQFDENQPFAFQTRAGTEIEE